MGCFEVWPKHKHRTRARTLANIIPHLLPHMLGCVWLVITAAPSQSLPLSSSRHPCDSRFYQVFGPIPVYLNMLSHTWPRARVCMCLHASVTTHHHDELPNCLTTCIQFHISHRFQVRPRHLQVSICVSRCVFACVAPSLLTRSCLFMVAASARQSLSLP